MNVLAFGASYHKASINKALASYTAGLFKDEHTIKILDLNQFEVPLFTVDREAETGHPKAVHAFIAQLEWADLIIISMAEHNGAYTAAFKNLFDWASRVKAKMFEGAKMFLLSTSPGGRGGQSVLELAKTRFPYHGAEILDTFSLPLFDENFDSEEGIKDEELQKTLIKKIKFIKTQF